MWRASMLHQAAFAASPVLDNAGSVFTATDGTGNVKWKYELDGFESATSATVDANGMILLTGDSLYDLNPDGTPRWEWADAEAFDSAGRGLSIGGAGTIYMTYGSNLYALE